MSGRDDERRRRSSRPLWLVEGLDIVEQRRGPLLGAVGFVVLVPLLLAVFAPSVVPPTPIVGAAVAIAALLLGLAAALAADTTDLIVRGPRHVGAAGGELVAILPTQVNTVSARALAASVLEAREPGTQMLLGIAGAGREALETAAWTDALAVALVRSGVSVLRIDLASGRTDRPGLAEVVKGEIRLTQAVDIEPGQNLARLGTGDDPIRALRALPSLPGRLPADLDVLLVGLPSATNREVVNATKALDHMLVMAHRDSTSRVQLIAALDALDATGTSPQVLLVDDATVARLGPTAFAGASVHATPVVGAGSTPPKAARAGEADGAAPDGSELTGDAAAVAGDAAAVAGDEPVTGAAASDEVASEPGDPAEPGTADAGSGAGDGGQPGPSVAGITGVGGGAVAAAGLAGQLGAAGADAAAAGAAGAGAAAAGAAGAGAAGAGAADAGAAGAGAAAAGAAGAGAAGAAGAGVAGAGAAGAGVAGAGVAGAGAAGASAAGADAAAGSAADAGGPADDADPASEDDADPTISAGSAGAAMAGAGTAGAAGAADGDGPLPEWQQPWVSDSHAESGAAPTLHDTVALHLVPPLDDTDGPDGTGAAPEAAEPPSESAEPAGAGLVVVDTEEWHRPWESDAAPSTAPAPFGSEAADPGASEPTTPDPTTAAAEDAQAEPEPEVEPEPLVAEAADEPAAEASDDMPEWERPWGATGSEEAAADDGLDLPPPDVATRFGQPAVVEPFPVGGTPAGAGAIGGAPFGDAGTEDASPSADGDAADASPEDIPLGAGSGDDIATGDLPLGEGPGDDIATGDLPLGAGSGDDIATGDLPLGEGPGDDTSSGPGRAAADAPPQDDAAEDASTDGPSLRDATADDPPSAADPRGVDVLMGAQEAAALAMAEVRDDDGAPPSAPDVDAPEVDDRAATEPQPESAVPPAADLATSAPARPVADDEDEYRPPPAIRIPDEYLPRAPSGVSPTPVRPRTARPAAGVTPSEATSPSPRPADPSAGPEHSTDELPAVRGPEPIRSAESDQDDWLRTTARMAVLMDDLDVRTGRDGDGDHPAP